MRTLAIADKNFTDDLAAFCRGSSVPREISDAVTVILADVRQRGDEAVAHYAAKFDGAKLRAREFRVKPADIAAAAKRLPPAERRALVAAHASIVAFNGRGLSKNWTAKNPQGALVGEKFDPIRRVGLYVPGGQVPLVSTVLMTATLAKIAGCPQIAVFTPSNSSGKIADGLLAALHLIGIDEVYRVGGVQAIGAMAYGTSTIPAVDKVYGPGNAYVCEAKRQVFGTVGVDSLPGPSEVMIIADDTARPDFAAADLLAQAEHGSGREKIYLVGTSAGVLAAIAAEVQVQLPTITRSEKTARVLADGWLSVQVDSLAQAAEVANYVAPEHLELLVKDSSAKTLTKAITTAGAIMLGNFTPTALGDFTAGPSHVLPTGRAGRFFSGLRVADFQRRTSLIRYDRAAVKRGAPVVAAFAAMERLDAHGRSVSIRTASARPPRLIAMSDLLSLALPHVAKLHAYTPGLQPTETGWVKLNTNECPYGPSPRVAEALRREIGEDGASLRLYPNPKSSPLRAAIAQHHGYGLTMENVIVGNGSDDILNLLVRAFCTREAAAGFTFPSYSLYPVLVEIQDGQSNVIAFDRAMKLPLERIGASKARAFFLTSPNAPTGVAFTNAELERVLASFPGLLVVDEAYAPFAKENAVSLLASHPRLVVVRTLSKAYALAGIRVGYALAHAEIIDLLDRVRDSYNVNRLSQAAALAALGDADYYANVIAKIKATRDHAVADLTARRGWFTYDSSANFIFTEPKNARGESGPAVAKAAYDFLCAHKILVRYFPSHALTASFLRISVGTDDEMLVLADTLDTWLKTQNA